MRAILFPYALLVVQFIPTSGQRLIPPKRYHAEDDDVPTVPEEDEEELDYNATTGELCVSEV